jgi:hypothetical protein
LVVEEHAQDVNNAQLDGIQILLEEHALDQFQYAHVFKNIQLMDIHAYHAQEIILDQPPTTRSVFQSHVPETPS